MVDMDLIPEERKWEIYKIVVSHMLTDGYINIGRTNEIVDEILNNYYDNKK